jgi:hypothetical protein
MKWSSGPWMGSGRKLSGSVGRYLLSVFLSRASAWFQRAVFRLRERGASIGGPPGVAASSSESERASTPIVGRREGAGREASLMVFSSGLVMEKVGTWLFVRGLGEPARLFLVSRSARTGGSGLSASDPRRAHL